MAAIISGPVLASLFYDQSSCPGDQEGLLIGKVQHSVRDTISDSQINNYKVETKLYIYSSYVIPRDRTLSRQEHLERCVTEQIKKHGDKCIVGWYRSRRNTTARLSMRERSTHHILLKALSSERHGEFYFLLCTSSNTANRSTHNFDFGFYKLNKNDGSFMKVPLSVVNLEDTTHNQYKHDASCTASDTSGIYASITSQFRSHILDDSGHVHEVKKITDLGSALQTKLHELTLGLSQSEQQLFMLEAEVRQRRKLIETKQEEKRVLKPVPVSPPSTGDETDQKVNSKVIPEDAVSIAKHKREQRRRDHTNKSIHSNLSSSRPSTSKTKGEQMQPLTRRLSAELETPEPAHSRRLSDEIAFIDEDVTEEMDTKTDNEQTGQGRPVIPPESGVILLPHEGQTVRITLPDSDISTNTKPTTLPPVISDNQIKPNPSSKDHFSFVSGLLAEEKTKPVKSKGVENPYTASSMSVPVGGQMKAPSKTTSQVAAAVGAATAAASTSNGGEETLRKSQRLQKNQPSQSASLSVNNKGQRSRTKESQDHAVRSRSKEDVKRKEHSSNMSSDFPTDVTVGSKPVPNHDADNPGPSSSACRYEANKEEIQNFEKEETDSIQDVHKISDHGQLLHYPATFARKRRWLD